MRQDKVEKSQLYAQKKKKKKDDKNEFVDVCK